MFYDFWLAYAKEEGFDGQVLRRKVEGKWTEWKVIVWNRGMWIDNEERRMRAWKKE